MSISKEQLEQQVKKSVRESEQMKLGYERQLIQWQQRYNDIEELMAQRQQEFDERENDLMGSLNSRQVEVMSLQSSLSALEEVNEARESELVQLKSEAEQLSAQLNERTNELDSQRDLRSKLIPENRELRKKLESQVSLNVRMQVQVEQIQKQRIEWESEVNMMRETLRSSRVYVNSKDNEIVSKFF